VSDEARPVTVEIAENAWQNHARKVHGIEAAVERLRRDLRNDPLLGEATRLPSLYHTRISTGENGQGTQVDIAYVYGPPTAAEGTVRIDSIRPVRPVAFDYEEPGVPLPEKPEPEPEPEPVRDPAMEEIEARQVTQAWQRITAWLGAHAPASHRTLLPGAAPEELARAEEAFGVRLRGGLKALWSLCAGVRDQRGAEFMLGNWALMTLDDAVELHGRYVRMGKDVWQQGWIPVCAFNAHDQAIGLCLDTDSGQLWYWDRYGDRHPEFESLTTYLEEMADALDVPDLAGPPAPGLIRGALRWGPTGESGDGWEPFTG